MSSWIEPRRPTAPGAGSLRRGGRAGRLRTFTLAALLALGSVTVPVGAPVAAALPELPIPIPKGGEGGSPVDISSLKDQFSEVKGQFSEVKEIVSEAKEMVPDVEDLLPAIKELGPEIIEELLP